MACQILRKLSAGNLVRVSRGALGGCALSCDLDATSLYDLMGAMGERGVLYREPAQAADRRIRSPRYKQAVKF